jgi:hypothetical protein
VPVIDHESLGAFPADDASEHDLFARLGVRSLLQTRLEIGAPRMPSWERAVTVRVAVVRASDRALAWESACTASSRQEGTVLSAAEAATRCALVSAAAFSARTPPTVVQESVDFGAARVTTRAPSGAEPVAGNTKVFVSPARCGSFDRRERCNEADLRGLDGTVRAALEFRGYTVVEGTKNDPREGDVPLFDALGVEAIATTRVVFGTPRDQTTLGVAIRSRDGSHLSWARRCEVAMQWHGAGALERAVRCAVEGSR